MAGKCTYRNPFEHRKAAKKAKNSIRVARRKKEREEAARQAAKPAPSVESITAGLRRVRLEKRKRRAKLCRRVRERIRRWAAEIQAEAKADDPRGPDWGFDFVFDGDDGDIEKLWGRKESCAVPNRRSREAETEEKDGSKALRFEAGKDQNKESMSDCTGEKRFVLFPKR